jgi:hypothetical protein
VAKVFASSPITLRKVKTGSSNRCVDQSDQSQLGNLEVVAAAYGEHLEADGAKGVAVENHAPVKHERGLLHGIVHGGPIEVAKFFPLRRDNDRLTVLSS